MAVPLAIANAKVLLHLQKPWQQPASSGLGGRFSLRKEGDHSVALWDDADQSASRRKLDFDAVYDTSVAVEDVCQFSSIGGIGKRVLEGGNAAVTAFGLDRASMYNRQGLFSAILRSVSRSLESTADNGDISVSCCYVACTDSKLINLMNDRPLNGKQDIDLNTLLKPMSLEVLDAKVSEGSSLPYVIIVAFEHSSAAIPTGYLLLADWGNPAVRGASNSTAADISQVAISHGERSGIAFRTVPLWKHTGNVRRGRADRAHWSRVGPFGWPRLFGGSSEDSAAPDFKRGGSSPATGDPELVEAARGPFGGSSKSGRNRRRARQGSGCRLGNGGRSSFPVGEAQRGEGDFDARSGRERESVRRGIAGERKEVGGYLCRAGPTVGDNETAPANIGPERVRTGAGDSWTARAGGKSWRRGATLANQRSCCPQSVRNVGARDRAAQSSDRGCEGTCIRPRRRFRKQPTTDCAFGAKTGHRERKLARGS
ncbi:hypothetical protein DFJ74DRAFT_168595 [Hyaloraphidium curvatum]|nr:hypothetical protein DFJ74DRAFT_168595 [Hyaloraphidium curvatum]